mgnify:CR=1 FL=1
MIDLEAFRDMIGESGAVCARGGGTRWKFGGPSAEGTKEVIAPSGIEHHDPAEMTVRVGAATPLSQLHDLLREHGQETTLDGPIGCTVGGVLAVGRSSLRRGRVGALTESLLQADCVGANGMVFTAGGPTVKNVAGYDVSRLTTGAMGTLGVILDVSIRVHPLPESEKTLCYELTEEEALKKMNKVSGRPLPLTGACYYQGVLSLRLSGSVEGVSAAVDVLGGSQVSGSESIWAALRDHSHPYFISDKPLWRLSLPSVAGSLDLAGETFIEWGGALRWLQSELSPDLIRASVEALGGHATLFRGGDRSGSVFHPNPRALHELNVRLKRTFDPDGILNPGRLYPDI